MNKITQYQALQILVDTAEQAVQRGGFKLAEAKIIAEAVEVVTKKPEPVVEPVEESVEAPVIETKKTKKKK